MNSSNSTQRMARSSKALAYLMVTSVLLYLLNNYLVFWQGLPGPYLLLLDAGWFGESQQGTLTSAQQRLGGFQLAGYAALLVAALWYALKLNKRSLRQESLRFQALSAYLVRVAFWGVLLIGCIDALISFLRIEGFLELWLSDELVTQLGRSVFRGSYVHYPLLLLALVLAFVFNRISFSWLALMVVLAEFQIVLTRFIFSYEQAFMGDLVRFWYAALFLFASAYTLIHEGHVRVDVFYAGFGRVKKAWSNIIGTLLLGMPLCWVILMQGMGGKGNSINSPLLSFEISQSGYGLYVKYLMAGFLVVFAVTMLIQFTGYLLLNLAELIEPRKDTAVETSSTMVSETGAN